MIRKTLEYIKSLLEPEMGDVAVDRDAAIRLASAALLMEVARADHDVDESEADLLLKIVRERYLISDHEASLLALEADKRVEDSVSLFEFTRTLHEQLNDSEKTIQIRGLWEIAYADGLLDKYEDALIHKIGELLYVPRSEVLRQKQIAINSTRI